MTVYLLDCVNECFRVSSGDPEAVVNDIIKTARAAGFKIISDPERNTIVVVLCHRKDEKSCMIPKLCRKAPLI